MGLYKQASDTMRRFDSDVLWMLLLADAGLLDYHVVSSFCLFLDALYQLRTTVCYLLVAFSTFEILHIYIAFSLW